MERWLITGAGRGIAREMTLQLLARGDAVIATVRSEPAAQALRADAGAGAGRLETLAFDVRDRTAIAAAGRKVRDGLDVVVSSAGVLGPRRQSALDMDFDGFLDTLAINTLAPLALAQAFLPHLRAGQRPRYVWITSRMGSFSEYQKDDLIAYQASKAAANKLARAMSMTLASQGVIVLAAHPGLVRTEMSGVRATDSPHSISPEQSGAGLIRVIDRLTPADSGHFLDWSGAELGW